MTAAFHGPGFSQKAAWPPGTTVQVPTPGPSASSRRRDSSGRMMMSSLAASTSVDTLTGSQGDDWYFVHTKGALTDTITSFGTGDFKQAID